MQERGPHSRERPTRTAWWILCLLCCWAAPGCQQTLETQRIPVPGSDAQPPVKDSAPGDIPDAAPAAIPLTLTLAKPDHGPFVGGTTVVLTGSGFDQATDIRFGGRAVQPNQKWLQGPTSLKVMTPAGVVGAADITVTRGSVTATLKGGFHYDRVFLDPASGPTVGGTLVTLQGKDTAFSNGMKLILGGKPMLEVEVISATVLRAKTPPSAMGPAMLVMGSPGGDLVLRNAFDYYQSASPFFGGVGGGPIKGTLTVTVLDAMTRNPVDSAMVVVQKGRAFSRTSFTGPQGAAVFADASLKGPLSVTAGKKAYETTTVADFDARDATIFLTPIIEPGPGPPLPRPTIGTVQGNVVFGGPTGIGSTQWKLVPEPQPGQTKRVYVHATVPYVYWSLPQTVASAIIDFKDNGAKAWPYLLGASTGIKAIYATAGIYTKATSTFQPYAMGVARGVVVGPGEQVRADILVDIPLKEKVTIEFADLPGGPRRYAVTLGLDLGAEGLILREDLMLAGEGVLSQLTLGRLPSFNHQGLRDASYSVHCEVDTLKLDGLPMVRAQELQQKPKAGVLKVDRFVGPPEGMSPGPGNTLQGNTLQWSSKGAVPSIAEAYLVGIDKTPIWHVIVRGSATRVSLPDPAFFGLPPWPKGKAVWHLYLAHLPSHSFDNFTYLHLYAHYWDRWSYNRFSIALP